METNELIQRLSGSATPIRRLMTPWRRAGLWLAASLSYVVLILAFQLREADGMGLIDVRLAIELAGMLATALTAALAALSALVPGYDCRIRLLPLLPVAVWLGSLGESCIDDWLRFGADGLRLRADWDCALPAIALSLVPTGTMIAMLRRGAPLVPALSLSLGMLASAAVTNLALRIFHIGDNSLMVLVWHAGGAIVVSAIAAELGRRVLKWRLTSTLSHVVPLPGTR